MMECVRGMQAKMRRAGTQRRAKNKSVLNQRSLGTIKKRKQEKKEDDSEAAAANGSLDMAMKLLRMRPGTGDFLQQQMATMNALQMAAVGGSGASPARSSIAGSAPGTPAMMSSNSSGAIGSAGRRESRLPPMPQAGLGQAAYISPLSLLMAVMHLRNKVTSSVTIPPCRLYLQARALQVNAPLQRIMDQRLKHQTRQRGGVRGRYPVNTFTPMSRRVVVAKRVVAAAKGGRPAGRIRCTLGSRGSFENHISPLIIPSHTHLFVCRSVVGR